MTTSDSENYDLTHWSLDEKELDEQANSLSVFKRKQVAKNPSTRAETLARLAHDRNLGVIIEVANNPSTRAETLARLAMDKNFNIRARVCCNPSTSQETLEGFANDREELIRKMVARKISTNSKTLDKLVNDRNYEVRMAALRNHSISPKTLERLANDADIHVRCYVASNPNTPYETLLKLSHDRGSYDTEIGYFKAKKNYVNYHELLNETKPRFSQPQEYTVESTYQEWVHEGWKHCSVSESAITTLSILEEIIKNYHASPSGFVKPTDVNIRCALARSCTTPQMIIRQLANDIDAHVRYYVASNPNTPHEILRGLTHDTASFDIEIGHFESSKPEAHRLSQDKYSLKIGIDHRESSNFESEKIYRNQPEEHIINSTWIHEGWENHSINCAAIGTLNMLEGSLSNRCSGKGVDSE